MSQNFLDEKLELPQKPTRPENDLKVTEKNVSIACKEQDKKNFIHRNIELAAAPVERFPLTIKEKEHLKKILEDLEDSNKAENTDENKLDNIADLANAYSFSEQDRNRLCEIDFELDNYEETRHLRPQDETNNLWKDLDLKEILDNIDNKLDEIKLEDDIQEFE